MKIKGELVFSFGLVLLIGFLIWESMRYNQLARLVPLVVLIPGMIFALIQFGLDLRAALSPEKKETKPKPEGEEGEKKQKLTPKQKMLRELVAYAWLLGLFLLIVLFGLSAAIPVFVLLFMRFFGNESWRLSVIFSLACWAFVYVVFVWFLRNDLYPGIILPMFAQ
jgi:hypothetical protein